jgi:hypothetical protein
MLAMGRGTIRVYTSIIGWILYIIKRPSPSMISGERGFALAAGSIVLVAVVFAVLIIYRRIRKDAVDGESSEV